MPGIWKDRAIYPKPQYMTIQIKRWEWLMILLRRDYGSRIKVFYAWHGPYGIGQLRIHIKHNDGWLGGFTEDGAQPTFDLYRKTCKRIDDIIA